MDERVGVILAGGKGTRLRPLTDVTSKQLLPVYDKPMIYYPLSLLLLAKIKTILMIVDRENKPLFQKLLGDGSQLGIEIVYSIQDQPVGLPDAYNHLEASFGRVKSMLLLGDNLFFGASLTDLFATFADTGFNSVFSYKVKDPSSFGVIEYRQGSVFRIVEKPAIPPSSDIVPGAYCLDENAYEVVQSLSPSKRGELEIGDLLQHYIDGGNLRVLPMGRGVTWFDTGSFSNLNAASNFVEMIQQSTGQNVLAPEEIAFQNAWINSCQFNEFRKKFAKSGYLL